MGRKRSYIPLNVYMGERLVGGLTREKSGAVSFAYDQTWLDWQYTMPISLSLPLRTQRYIGAVVIAMFENLLPDNVEILRRIAEEIGAEGTDAYSMLAKLGRDCIGALQIIPVDVEPIFTNELTGTPQTDAQIEALLKDFESKPLGIQKENDFRISVAGAQDKTALLFQNGTWIKPTGTTPTTHILKPQIGMLPNGFDLSQSVENEHYCMRLMESFNLPTAQTEIIDFGEARVLSIKRFDRRWTKDGRLIRLPQEDCCQALSVPPTQKYQVDGGPGIVEIVKLLQASDEPLVDQYNFFKANILFWLIGATDGHAKNFSIALMPGGRFKMTSLYDVLTVQPMLDAHQLNRKAMKLAMRVGKNNHYRIDTIVGRHFFETAHQAGLSESTIQKIIDDIAENWENAFENTLFRMPDDFPEELHVSVKSAFDNRLELLKGEYIRSQ